MRSRTHIQVIYLQMEINRWFIFTHFCRRAKSHAYYVGEGWRCSQCHNKRPYCQIPQGFFRRSIQQNIQYKKCLKDENCPIMRINRNRCQQCRFKKCLSVGMSRDGELKNSDAGSLGGQTPVGRKTPSESGSFLWLQLKMSRYAMFLFR